MSSPRLPSIADEIVPLSERLRFLQLFRVGVSALVVGFALQAPETLTADIIVLGPLTGAYLVGMLVLEGGWRLTKRRGLPVFGLMLIVDGAYLAWLVGMTGGPASPLRHVILLHLVAVALLASYRTGLKLALWHSLLLVVATHAARAEIVLSAPVVDLPGSDFKRLVGFLVAVWMATLFTSAFSAINERELRRHRFDLEALARFATELESALDVAGVARVTGEAISSTFDLARTVVLANSPAGLEVAARTGCEDVEVAVIETRPGGIADGVAASRGTLLVSDVDVARDPWLEQLMPGCANLVVVPLTAHGEVVGAMIAEHGIRGGSRVERRVVATLERFGAHCALAMHNARLLSDVQRLATVDELTGLANRRSFDDALRAQVNLAQRSREAVSLAMIDIDRFKQLNDAFGHQVGDEVLARVAATLGAAVREYDIPARYGGEEFAIILPHTSTREASEVAERVRRTIAEDLREPTVTVSVGLATAPTHARTPDELIRHADEAMYASKEAGRDRVTVALQPEPSVVPDPVPAGGRRGSAGVGTLRDRE